MTTTQRGLVVLGATCRDHGRQQAAPTLTGASGGSSWWTGRPAPLPAGYLFVPFGGMNGPTWCAPGSMLVGDGSSCRSARSTGWSRTAPGRSSSDAELGYDYLVIATGTSPRPDQTPGMLGPAVARSIFDFYTFEGVEALAELLRRVQPRPDRRAHHRDADQVPGRPAEFTFLAEATCGAGYATGRAGLRDPARRGLHQARRLPRRLGAMLDGAQDHVEPTSWSSGSTTSARSWSPTTSARCLRPLVTVPLNMGADYVARSGLGDEPNYVPVDKHTLLSTKYDDIFALGDASDIPTSKAGSVAHFSVEVFVENFLAARRRAAMTRPSTATPTASSSPATSRPC